MASVLVSPSPPGTLYVRDPFSFTFSSDYSSSYSMQFTDSSATLVQYTNATTGTFASTLGAALSASNANLVVDAITLNQGTVAVYAGDGIAGSDDGVLTAASFRNPSDGVFDANGNFYICDAENHVIRKIDTGGNVTTIAGISVPGFADGVGTLAAFDTPTGFAIDASAGIVYIADTNNHAIRAMNVSTLAVTTYAGGAPTVPESGSTDGTGTASRFFSPTALAFDSVTSNIFVADTGNHTVRKIAPGAVVTTVAGLAGSQGSTDATGSSARFRSPAGMSASNSMLYVSDTGNHTIRRVTSNAVVTTYAGFPGSVGFSNATGSLARFNTPSRSFLDASGNLYVAETGNNAIRKVFTGGVVTTYAGSGTLGNTNGVSTLASFYAPSAVRADSNGVVYAIDTGNSVIRSIVATPDVRPSGTHVPGTVIVATATYPVTILSRLEFVTATPPLVDSNTIQLYQYEPYTYVVQKNRPLDTIRGTSSSVEIPFTSNVSQISFASTTGYNTSYSYPLQFIVEALDASGLVVDTLSNTVRVSPGRWVLAQTPPYTFYRGESVGTGYTFLSSIALSQAFVTPTLPVGISFTQDPCSTQLYRLLGTPLLQTGSSNYTFVGRGTGGRIITTGNVGIRVDAERLLLTGGPSNTTGMSVGTPISPVTFTCSTPTTNTNLFRFSGDILPSGLVYADASDVPVSMPYTIPNGTPKIIKVIGSPNASAASTFQSNSVNRLFTSNVTLRATLGTLAADSTLSFTFGPTVLFTSQYSASAGPKLFVGIPMLSNVIYKAATFFSNTTNTITNIAASSLPAGLSLNFVSDASGAYLTGTPTTELTSPALYTITATDSSGNTGSISSYIPVVQNTLTFDYGVTPAVDTSFSFIQSRALSNAKTGYYTQPIQFKTTSLAGFATTFTMTGLEGTGIVLSNLGNGTALLTGTPTTSQASGTVTIAATDGNASASTTIQAGVLADVYTFNTLSPSQLAFLQNRVITPIQFTATTLSERAVQTYSSLDIPSGLTLTPRGVLSGTPTAGTGGTFTITATNGISSGSATYTYTVVPDSVLILSTVNTIQLTPGQTVGPLNIDGLSYSGRTVSNFVFSNLSPTYGLTLTSTPGVGIVDGVLTTSLPPSLILPSNDTFQILGSAGSVDGSANFVLATSNALKYRTFVSWYNDPSGSSLVKSDESIAQWNTSNQLVVPFTSFVSDFQARTTNPVLFNSNTFLAITGSNLYRSTNGTTFTLYPTGLPIYSLANLTGTNTWFGAGYNGAGVALSTSSDDGLTWSVGSAIPGILARIRTPPGGNTGGVVLREKGGVLMLGGTTILRSPTLGASWSGVAGGFQSETHDFSLDASRWIAVGSDSNVVDSGGIIPPSVTGNTILYSDDLGVSWSSVAGGYTYSGLTVANGSNGWVSTGIDYSGGQYQAGIKYSANGATWIDLNLGVTLPSTGNPPGPWPTTSILQRFGPVYCNGDMWSVFVSYVSGPTVLTDIYQHDISTNLGMGWVRTDVSGQFPPATSQENRLTGLLGPLYIPQEGPFDTTLTYTDLSTVGGPTFTAPPQTEYILYQYIPITPITIAATGTNTRIFIRDEDLPVGLVFNTLTGVISGRPIELGEKQRVPVYARDATGITVLTLTFTVLVPRVTRQQSSASAYTSLVQQYTIVNSAQNARDSRVYPAQSSALGEFMSPSPPSVITPDSNPNCVKKC